MRQLDAQEKNCVAGTQLTAQEIAFCVSVINVAVYLTGESPLLTTIHNNQSMVFKSNEGGGTSCGALLVDSIKKISTIH